LGAETLRKSLLGTTSYFNANLGERIYGSFATPPSFATLLIRPRSVAVHAISGSGFNCGKVDE